MGKKQLIPNSFGCNRFIKSALKRIIPRLQILTNNTCCLKLKNTSSHTVKKIQIKFASYGIFVCACMCPAILHKWPIFNVVNERHKFRNTTQLQTYLSLMICTCTSTALKCPLPTRRPRFLRRRCLVTIAMTSNVFMKLFLNMQFIEVYLEA